jgi:hypothetical protein
MVLFVLLGGWTLARVILARRARTGTGTAPDRQEEPATDADDLSPATAAP